MAAAKKVWKATEGKVGKNTAYAINDKGIMTITVDLNLDLGDSASGKTRIVATSAGNVAIEGGNGAVMGLTIYRKPA